jgi:cobyric acid synthase CobQ/L-threonine-O-3-phosphate decarboxylase
LAARAGLDREAVLDFSASVNPLGPPELLRMTLSRAIDQLVHYPDPECADLVAALAQRCRVTPQQIVVGNGSTELLFALARACDFDRALIPVPSYLDYESAIRRAGRPVQFLTLSQSNGFGLDWDLLEADLRPRDLVMLGQPNNPTGLLLDVERLRAVAARHPTATLVVDEAFADFVPGYRSLAEHLPDNLIVLRSLTKFYAIPGLRLGFVVARPEVAACIRREILPWSVNSLAQAAGMAVLADEDYPRQTLALVQSARRQLADDLARLPALYVYPGTANFLLARLDRKGLTAAELAQRLLRDGIAIRTFDAAQHLDQRFFRVAVRTPEENERLIDALAVALGERAVKTVPATFAARKKRTPALMIQGTSSNAGKSVLVAALCRILLQDGVRVAPFKSQNMSLNSFVTRDGGEMGRAQVVQAQACRLEPDVRMNPILLKPNSETGSQVIVRGRPVGNMQVAEYVQFKTHAVHAAFECYDALAAEFDAMLLEGAGSPGEVNLKSHDIANMRMAQYAAAPVLIVGDIDRGGIFASFVGTMEVLAPWERRLVAGWIVNRFRGDASLLAPALDYTRLHTGRPVLGVVPYLTALDLPQEDSVEFKSGALDQGPTSAAAVEIAVIDLPHISNFTDFDAFRGESDVRLRVVRSAAELRAPDAVIIPGSKNTLDDLAYLRRSGLAEQIAALARDRRSEVVGICGGFQMLGREVRDPLGIESGNGHSTALGLMATQTVLAAEKTLVRTSARHAISGLEVSGYEIHHGQTTTAGAVPWFTRADGQVVGAARPDHRVWGTYLHGVFDADAFRRWFIDRLRAHRGLEPLGQGTGHYDIEPALDRLAAAVRESICMDPIYRLLGL